MAVVLDSIVEVVGSAAGEHAVTIAAKTRTRARGAICYSNDRCGQQVRKILAREPAGDYPCKPQILDLPVGDIAMRKDGDLGQPLVGPIDWGAYDGNLVEQTISVMLLMDRERGWQRQASSGDAGVDVAIRIVGRGFEVSQIKSYTGPLTSNRKKEIERSLKSVIEGPELPGRL
ncbi:MAG: hypothetical protein ACT4OP_10000 [Actinomycetota bacterium]